MPALLPVNSNLEIIYINMCGIWVRSNYLQIYGSFSEDTFGNSFANWSRDVSGNITVIKDGEVILDHEDIWDHFWEHIYFEDAPKFGVVIQGNSSPRLSTYIRTELNFTADPTKDYQPPWVTIRPADLRLNNTVPSGDIKVEMDVEDENNVSNVTLKYSLDNGSTWKSAKLVYKEVTGCKPISGGDRTVVDETYASPIYSKVRIFMDDTEDNDKIYYSYSFTLRKSDGTEYTKSGNSQSTLEDINDTLYYDEDNDGVLDLFKSIYLYAYTEDDDTLDVKVEAWNGTSWECLYGSEIRRYEADLGAISGKYVSVKANTTDSMGNRLSQTVIKGFYVSITPISTVSLNPPKINITLNCTNTTNLTLDSAPNGLSGYNITISLSNASVAEITSVNFPAWATLHSNSSLPADSLWIKAVDLNDQIKSGAMNITLATFTIRGDEHGTSNILITVTKMDDDSGNPIETNTITGQVEVIGVIPFPGCDDNLPTDPDNDGLYEDINGNSRKDFADVVCFFNYLEWVEGNQPRIEYFDFNKNGRIDFDDVVKLFEEI